MTSGPAEFAVVHDVAALRAAVRAARNAGRTIGLVPTMGALHAGHASLVDAAADECDFVVATIFVNPTQFGPHEDLDKYPRTLEADLQLLRQHGAHLAFVPDVATMYPPGHETSIDVGTVALPWEGASRPGHFDGVATVVAKLFNQVLPDIAYFGQKDYQQTLVIRRLAADLDFALTLRICPTVRDADGLALSSRNAYLTADERHEALALSRGLRAAERLYAQGERHVEAIRDAMLEVFAAAPGLALEYLAIADAETLAELHELDRPAVVALAARVGSTRLIDNCLLRP